MALFTSAGIASALGISAGLFTTVSAFALNAVVGVGISLAAQSLAGKPEEGPRFSIEGKLRAGADVPRSFPLGWTATAGSLVYANTWGNAGDTPNAYLTQVIALSDLPRAGLDQLWVDGRLVTINYGDTSYDMGFPVQEYDTGNNNHLWIKFYDGTQIAADPFLVGKVSSADSPWQSTRVGTGVAYAIVTAQVNEDLFQGFPEYKFALDGLPLYDISKDSSVGGSGPQRWNDPATWGGDGDDLPAVQQYSLLRGFTFGGKWVYGLQNLPAARLPAANWIAAENNCHVPIQCDGQMEPTYRSGGEIRIAAPVADAINALNTACQGRLAEVGGAYMLHVGAPGTSVYSFDDDRIISTEEQSFTPFFGLADTINGITARYPSPRDGWNTQVAAPLYRSDLEAEDGNRRLLADVPFDLVPYAAQVQRLMKSALEEARRAGRHTLVLPPEATLAPNDFITWTSLRNGYAAKLFRVDGVIRKPNLDNIIDITEVDPSDYNPPAAYQQPPASPLGPIRPPSQPMTGWQVQPATMFDAEGEARRPSIEVFFSGNQVDVRAARVQVRLAETAAVIFDGDIPYGNPATNQNPRSVILNGTFLPNTNYQVRGIFVPSSGRLTEWSGWLPVLTPDARIGDGDIYDGVIGFPKLKEDVQEWQEWIGQGLRETIDEILELATEASTQDLKNFDDKQTLRRELVSTRQGIEASYTEAIIAATGPGSALVQRIETLEVTIPKLATVTAVDALTVRVDANANGITVNANAITSINAQLPGKASVTALNALTTRVTSAEGNITANANAITALEAEVDGVSAQANFRMEVQAGVAGYSSRIAAQARVGGAGNWRAASWFLDVPASDASPTRFAVVADQFIITDGTNNASPFVFSGGVARMNMANIGTVTAGIVRSADSRMVINLTNANIIMADNT